MFCHIFERVLNGKVLTPITDEDFFREEQEIKESPEYLKENGLKSDLQCPRYSSLFRKETLDGVVTYNDVDRIITIDQHKGTWHNGWAENLCKEYIPQITMPYMPSDTKIKIYVWEFSYDKTLEKPFYVERGSYNTIYIRYIKLQNDKIIPIEKCYIEGKNGDEVLELTPKMFDELNKVIEQDVIDFREECDE